MLDERGFRADADACLDDFVSGDAEIVLLEIDVFDAWRLLGGQDASSF